MSKQIDLACTMCTEEFLVPSGVYIAHYGALACPCCGSTDLIRLGVSASSVHVDSAAA